MIINIDDDFCLYKIAKSGQCFRARSFDDGTFRFVTASNVLYIREVASHRYDVSCNQSTWESIWHSYFDLDRCYANVRNLIPADDAFMLKASEEGKGIRILRQDPWETLISFIISQRKSIPAIKTAVENLCRQFGQQLDAPNDTIYFFPSAETLYGIADQQLRECDLGYRVPYVRDAARCVFTNEINLENLLLLNDDLLRCKLKNIKGVGNKVANCVMLFAYGRTTSVPVDVWIKRLIEENYDGNSPFPRYGTNAGIMQQYAFYYMLENRGR